MIETIAIERMKQQAVKSVESWIRDAACSIRGAKDAPKYKEYILPLIFTRRLCDVFEDELSRIVAEVGSRKKAFQLASDLAGRFVRHGEPHVLRCARFSEIKDWSRIRVSEPDLGSGQYFRGTGPGCVNVLRRHSGEFGHPATNIAAIRIELFPLPDWIEDTKKGCGVGAATGDPLSSGAGKRRRQARQKGENTR